MENYNTDISSERINEYIDTDMSSRAAADQGADSGSSARRSEESCSSVSRSEGSGSSESHGSDPSGNTEDGGREESGASFMKTFLIDVLVAVALAAIILSIIRPTVVRQTSMLNTLHNNDYMIMYKLAYKNHGPERGDIIIFQSSLVNEDTGEDKLLIKRVIGLPGDDISIVDSQLYLNGEAYEEDYLKDGDTPAFDIPMEGETFHVPDDCYFCMGDNRRGSIDSRYYEVGCVHSEQIEGKVVLRLFPFNKIQRF